MGGTLRVGRHQFDVEFMAGRLMVTKDGRAMEGECIVDIPGKSIKIKRHRSMGRMIERLGMAKDYLVDHYQIRSVSDVSFSSQRQDEARNRS